MKIFEKHAPLKYKYMRENEGRFMTKELRKAIMIRSKLCNRFYKHKTKTAEIAYKKTEKSVYILTEKS